MVVLESICSFRTSWGTHLICGFLQDIWHNKWPALSIQVYHTAASAGALQLFEILWHILPPHPFSRFPWGTKEGFPFGLIYGVAGVKQRVIMGDRMSALYACLITLARWPLTDRNETQRWGFASGDQCRLLTNWGLLLITDYMMKIVVNKVI